MQFSGLSHGQYIRWCTAAEPKSHSTSSPVRVYSAYRHSLSLVHSPIATPVRYLMLLLSNTSSAPRPACSMACLARSRLSRRVGCSASLISQIERGVSVPSVGVLYSLATELGSSLDYLLFGSGAGPDGVS